MNRKMRKKLPKIQKMRKKLPNIHEKIHETKLPKIHEKITLQHELLNEFEFNKEIIYGAFKDLLPLGEKTTLIPHGTVSPNVTRRLMRFFDPRFARSRDFRNFLFSQRRRHNMCRRTSKFRKAQKLGDLLNILDNPTIFDTFKKAALTPAHCRSLEGKELLNKILPYRVITNNRWLDTVVVCVKNNEKKKVFFVTGVHASCRLVLDSDSRASVRDIAIFQGPLGCR